MLTNILLDDILFMHFNLDLLLGKSLIRLNLKHLEVWKERKFLLPIAKEYLTNKYDYWNEDIIIYKKWRNQNEAMFMW